MEIKPAHDTKHENLEHGVDGHQHCGGFAVGTGQISPHQDHGDTAGKADDDEAGAQLGVVRQEQPRQGEHHQRAHQPVENERDRHQALVGRDFSSLVIANLGQRRVHHDEEAKRDGNGDAAYLDAIEGVGKPRRGIA